MFTKLNTEGFTDNELKILNTALERILESPWFQNGDADEREKVASDRLNNAWVPGISAEELIEAVLRCLEVTDVLTVVRSALEFVCWHRNMVIEGQIESTEYAKRRKPCDDHNLARALTATNDFLWVRHLLECRKEGGGSYYET